MDRLLGPVAPHASEEDVPDAFRAVVRAGWTMDGDAQLLTALRSGYSGGGRAEFHDVIHHEATVNGRGMMDHDLPASGPARLETLLRRSLGYACTGLLAVPPKMSWPMLPGRSSNPSREREMTVRTNCPLGSSPLAGAVVREEAHERA
ncbi:hypothetical protein OG985_18175 [Streptomyces sp. NBC_00289]|uniref:hypothetical protein n=1 Tax=Streptomyces sp. NBC_00289 TaxID=2975703 RepID=UPI003255ABAB